MTQTRKMSHRLLALLLVVAMAACLLPVFAAAATDGAALSFETDKAQVGDNVKLAVQVDTGVTDGVLVLTYDADTLTLQNKTDTTPDKTCAINADTAGKVVLAFAMDKAAAASSAVVELTFTPLKAGVAEVTLTAEGSYLHADKQTVTVTESTAQLTVEERAKPIDFEDVPDNVWYKPAVDYVSARGLMVGISKDSYIFGPEVACNRAMMVTILYRLSGDTVSPDAKMPFTDVVEGSFCYDAVLWAVEMGIAKGVTVTEFYPYRDLTRQEAVTFLHRYVQIIGGDPARERDDLSRFPDADEVRPFAREAMQWAVAVELVNGMSSANPHLAPAGVLTRAQMAQLLYKLCTKFGY